jgi:hypothetical protein
MEDLRSIHKRTVESYLNNADSDDIAVAIAVAIEIAKLIQSDKTTIKVATDYSGDLVNVLRAAGYYVVVKESSSYWDYVATQNGLFKVDRFKPPTCRGFKLSLFKMED